MEFVHLHTHTHYSMQSSPILPGELFAACKKQGMNTVAITDYAAMFNMPELFWGAEKAGLKLIIGTEIFLLESGTHQTDRHQQPPTLMLLIQNEVGYRNLCVILTKAAREGFQNGLPHLEKGMLENHHEGLYCLSAYNSGRIGRALLSDDYPEAKAWTGVLSRHVRQQFLSRASATRYSV